MRVRALTKMRGLLESRCKEAVTEVARVAAVGEATVQQKVQQR